MREMKSRLVPVASDDNLALLLLFRETVTVKQRSEKRCYVTAVIYFLSGLPQAWRDIGSQFSIHLCLQP